MTYTLELNVTSSVSCFRGVEIKRYKILNMVNVLKISYHHLASHVVLNLVQFIQSSKIMVKEFCSKVPSDRVGKLSTEDFFLPHIPIPGM
jgi:hypothetical protein